MPGDALRDLKLAIGASFTADALGEFAPLWSKVLGAPVEISIAPYGRLYQELLNPNGVLRDEGAQRFLFARRSDLAGGDDADAGLRELVETVNAAVGRFTIFLCPDKDGPDASSGRALREHLGPGCAVIDVGEIFTRYRVAAPDDPEADAAADVPYAPEAFAALSAEMIRRASATARRPLKLIAVDGDNTLWRGVVGEDGIDGVAIDEGARALQRRLKALAENGVILALLSKNDERDVAEILARREDMVLGAEDLLAVGVNWRAKAENLEEIAERFGVGDDAILFLDDSPVEIAAMRAARPGVLVGQIPQTPDEIARFAEHFWLLDPPPATQEDRRRMEMYRDDAARHDAARAAPTLQAFFSNLDLKVEIAEAGAGDMARLAQLTQRTNQFNATLARFSEHELNAWAASQSRQLFGVRVRDRFGDYGLVGVIGVEEEPGRLSVPLFTLSCRALGRGVEHRMAARIGALAVDAGAGSVAFSFIEGPRNAPAHVFLESVLPGERTHGEFIAPAKSLARLAFDPEANEPEISKHAGPQLPRSSSDFVETDQTPWLQIAEELTSGAAILAAATAERTERPPLAVNYAPPAPGLERAIADIWGDVLQVAPVGAHDPFTELGGKSIKLVQIHSRLVRLLGRPIEFTLLFECATVAQLARRLHGDASALSAAEMRAAAMRRARLDHGARLRAAREAMP